jgi:hypothetical protein
MCSGEKNMEIGGTSNISSLSSQPNSSIGNVTNGDKNTFFNLLVSQDREGTVFHELFLTATGNIDSCKISSIEDAKNILNGGETFKIAQPDPNQLGHLTKGISYLV